jgi:hypothetical protein
MKTTIWTTAALLGLTACSGWEDQSRHEIKVTIEAPPEEPIQEPEPAAAPTAKELAATEAERAEAEAAEAARNAAALAAREAADAARRQRAKKLFGEVMEPLTEASEAYERHDELDESTWFGEDQGDNEKHINELLDDAIRVLGVSSIETTRSELRLLDKEILDLEKQIIEDREARLGAPIEEELNTLEKTYKTSQEEYDTRIEEATQGITTRKARIRTLEDKFVTEMRGIGIDINLEGARSLLSTVNGDDFIEMCVVFDNVRGITEQLEALTESSGESLDAAKRYYGSYVVLIHLMDRIQKDFVRRTREEMVPKLSQYADKAQELIQQAQHNLDNGGDPKIAEQNIRANELTVQATQLYADYLRGQANEIEARNEDLQVTLRDAQSTYDTVSLSSQVAAIMKEGQRNFAALLQLQLPSLRGFENSELKAEFERLTRQMTTIN